MVSDKVMVSDKGAECEGKEAALNVIEKTAAFCGFSTEDAQELRKMADEMIVGSAAMLDVFSGTMWAETDDETFKVKLLMEGLFTQEERDRLIALTRDNKNTLPKGFFARLGVLLGDALSGEYYYPLGLVEEPGSEEVLWTATELAQMMEGMRAKEDPEDKALSQEAKVALDQLADDITVAARSDRVEITVSKKLPTQGA